MFNWGTFGPRNDSEKVIGFEHPSSVNQGGNKTIYETTAGDASKREVKVFEKQNPGSPTTIFLNMLVYEFHPFFLKSFPFFWMVATMSRRVLSCFNLAGAGLEGSDLDYLKSIHNRERFGATPRFLSTSEQQIIPTGKKKNTLGTFGRTNLPGERSENTAKSWSCVRWTNRQVGKRKRGYKVGAQDLHLPSLKLT